MAGATADTTILTAPVTHLLLQLADHSLKLFVLFPRLLQQALVLFQVLPLQKEAHRKFKMRLCYDYQELLYYPPVLAVLR